MRVPIKQFSILAVAILGVLVVLLFIQYQFTNTPKQRITGINFIDNPEIPTITADIVETPKKRAKGLAGRTNLSEGEGMLFVFPENGLHGIWMKGMLLSIDIIWLSEEKKIITIAEQIHPETYPASFLPERPARFVLEVPAGFAATHMLTTEMQLAFDV